MLVRDFEVRFVEDPPRLRERPGNDDELVSKAKALDRAFEGDEARRVDHGHGTQRENDGPRADADGLDRPHGALGRTEEKRPRYLVHHDAGWKLSILVLPRRRRQDARTRDLGHA